MKIDIRYYSNYPNTKKCFWNSVIIHNDIGGVEVIDNIKEYFIKTYSARVLKFRVNHYNNDMGLKLFVYLT